MRQCRFNEEAGKKNFRRRLSRRQNARGQGQEVSLSVKSRVRAAERALGNGSHCVGIQFQPMETQSHSTQASAGQHPCCPNLYLGEGTRETLSNELLGWRGEARGGIMIFQIGEKESSNNAEE